MKAMKKMMALLLVLTMLLSMSACGGVSERPEGKEETTVPVETVPAETVPADGNPNDVTCKGTYSADAASDAVVATIGEEKLTARQLQVYYWLEVAQYKAAEHETAPDFSKGLDTQVCEIDDSVNSWQQYFLKQALNTWHSHQALQLQSREIQLVVEDEFDPNEENHEKYLDDAMPALKYLYGNEKPYEPNTVHQAYLDAMADTMEEMAGDKGYSDLAEMAEDAAGVEEDTLLWYADLSNRAYMFFTELSYDIEPTAEDFAAYEQAGSYEAGEKLVDIRHLLVVPEEAVTDGNGVITSASEENWEAAMKAAEKLIKTWKKDHRASVYTFAQMASTESADSSTARDGGLFYRVAEGQLVPVLNDWAFAEERQVDDMEIIRSEYGYHIVYFCGSTTEGAVQAEVDLIAEESRKLVEAAKESYPADIDYGAIVIGPATQNGELVTGSELLYPDVSHERFPQVQVYLQQDYPKAKYGNFPLRTYGCGPTTMAMLATYLADEEYTAGEIAKLYGSYCGQNGTAISMFDYVPAELGFYTVGRNYVWQNIEDALYNGQVAVCLQHKGFWTRGGHFLLLKEMNEEGLVVVRDSNIFNYGKLAGHMTDGFSSKTITPNGKHYWIYQHKVLSIPACARCGVEEVGTQFVTDYCCRKCHEAVGRRDNFLELCSAV